MAEKEIKQKFRVAINTYNKIAKIYSDYTFDKINQFQLNKFISMVPKKAKILDVACGSGRDAQYFLDYEFKVEAIDAAEEMIKEAKKRVKKVKFKVMDFRKMEYKDNFFDAMWAAAALIHTEKKDIPKTLLEFKRVMKQNGILYISVKQGEGEKVVKKEKYLGHPRPFVYFDQIEIETMLRESGFVILNSAVNQDFDDNNQWIEIYVRKP